MLGASGVSTRLVGYVDASRHQGIEVSSRRGLLYHHALRHGKRERQGTKCAREMCGRKWECGRREADGGKRGGRECNESGGTTEDVETVVRCEDGWEKGEGGRRKREGGGKEARAESEHFTWRCVVGLGLVEVHRGGRRRRDTSNNRRNHRLLTPGTTRGDELTEQLHATGLHTRRVKCTAGNLGPLGVRVNA